MDESPQQDQLQLIEHLMSAAHIRRRAKVLGVGCGTGAAARPTWLDIAVKEMADLNAIVPKHCLVDQRCFSDQSRPESQGNTRTRCFAT